MVEQQNQIKAGKGQCQKGIDEAAFRAKFTKSTVPARVAAEFAGLCAEG